MTQKTDNNEDSDILENDAIEVLRAKVHHLENIDIFIPKIKLVVITGIKGPGKSSQDI